MPAAPGGCTEDFRPERGGSRGASRWSHSQCRTLPFAGYQGHRDTHCEKKMSCRETKSCQPFQPGPPSPSGVTCAVLSCSERTEHLRQDPDLPLSGSPPTPTTHSVSFPLGSPQCDLPHGCSTISCPHLLLGVTVFPRPTFPAEGLCY